MARYYSDHFNATGTVASLASSVGVALDTQFKPAVSLAHPRLRRKRAHLNIGTVATIGDELRLMKFKSSDRLYNIIIQATGATAAAADIGLYKSLPLHAGDEIDKDLFATALALTAEASANNRMLEATTIALKDVGKTLWELADLGGPTYTSDPMEEWDLVMTVTTSFTVAVNDMVIFADYTAGD